MLRLPIVGRRVLRIPVALAVVAVLYDATARSAMELHAADGGDATIVAALLADRGHQGPTRFQLLDPTETGVDFTIDWTPRGGVSIQGLNSPGSCGGVAIGDYDGDERPDLFLTRPFGGNRLYRNLGGLRFEDVTEEAGLEVELEHDAWGTGSSFVDVDNDGDLDLYVCSYGRPNRLYVNQGDGTFVERSGEYGLDFSGASVTMAFADFDLDGDLDSYLVTNWPVPESEADAGTLETYWEFRDGRIRVSKEHQERYDVVRLPSGKIKIIQAAQLDHFYRNDGERFVEATRQVLGDYSASENFHGLAARWFDYDGDGYPDLYVSNDYYGPDQLFHNQGDGTLRDVTRTALPHVPWYSMGTDAGDVDNDGRMDFMATDMAFTTHHKFHTSRGRVPDEAWFIDVANPKQQVTNALYLNTGTSRFLEAAALAGLASTDWTWAIKFADFDNDGRIDVYVTNGAPRNWTDSDAPQQIRLKSAGTRFVDKWNSFWKHQPPLKEQNYAFRNLGDLRFEEVAREWGLDFVGVSFGSALGDLDGDGDLDVVTVNYEDQAHIYRNVGSENHRVAFKLNGTRANRMAIGAVVSVETEDGLQVRDLPSVRGFMSADEPQVYFGLGRRDVIRRLTIRWPGGAVQRFDDLPADRRYTIIEPADRSLVPSEKKAVVEPMFVRRDDMPRIVHKEAPFDDFALQPLLPRRLSRLGPGIACGDVDGDSLDDFYLAGAHGMLGQLLVGEGPSFVNDTRSAAAFQTNWSSEELAPLLFDADGDGDLDLYVVNGGVESVPTGDEFHDLFFLGGMDESPSSPLQDRLYLNDGRGTFVPAPGDALPALEISGSVVVAGDFDRDGDLDLFVGGRVVPGKYPQTPPSVLLRNDRGKFVDVTQELAPGLDHVGMVTSAVWSDADGDGWSDLLVTCEWGPVQLWRNDAGQLRDATQAAGLATRTGWWNGIAAGDLDHDGDVDYVVTNFGLCTRYRATQQHPAVLLVADLDDDGTDDLVEAEYVDENLVPVRDKSSLVDAMPILADQWPTFEQFAKSTLAELFGDEALRPARRFEANTLESGILLNDGAGRFAFQALPRIAQVSPGFGCAIVDVDADGHNDLYLVQNFFSPQRFTTRMDGGVSQLLLGDGKGGLRPVPPHESGLVVPGDAKAFSVVDLNHDGRPDFLVTVNDGELLAFENHAGKGHRMLTMRLVGHRGNPTAVGARVTLTLSDGTTQTAEIHCGGGYLSQSSPTLFFGLGSAGQAERVAVRWPDGNQSDFVVPPGTTTLTLKQPDS